ncbi:four-helix bundle copper-binding protein [Alicyclobacillus fastidiosus]|uniref:Four-helix bundle copper-binding protein n=1 Tax=Alicyclobacillus fastidiosus TaxID=392011 RepID=A0ABV5ACG9_9BACL|nr:four-helix bundle copper-binding protein [Alicyclobacillus fastidiosus]WEH11408.1 four-helix bundle copper-binding protein [Alicyclobacillus fastidiosus]
MPNENNAEQDFTPDYRSEGKPSYQPKKAYHKPPKPQPMHEEESPSYPSPEMQFSLEIETESPVVQYVKKPVPKPKPAPTTQFTYMQYEFEEEQVEFDPGLFAAHPVHQCPNICEQVKDCMLTCERTIHMLMCRPDAYMHARQIAMLQDCVEVCLLTTRQIARRSPMLKIALRYCAKVCRMCGHECMRFPGPESQACARICLHCSKICEKYMTTKQWA